MDQKEDFIITPLRDFNSENSFIMSKVSIDLFIKKVSDDGQLNEIKFSKNFVNSSKISELNDGIYKELSVDLSRKNELKIRIHLVRPEDNDNNASLKLKLRNSSKSVLEFKNKNQILSFTNFEVKSWNYRTCSFVKLEKLLFPEIGYFTTIGEYEWIVSCYFYRNEFNRLKNCDVFLFWQNSKHIGIKLINDFFPFREFNVEQEDELNSYYHKVVGLDMENKEREVSHLKLPEFSKLNIDVLICPLYRCLETFSSREELRNHITNNHNELQKYILDILPNGQVVISEEMINFVLIAQKFYSEFTRLIVLPSGFRKLDKFSHI